MQGQEWLLFPPTKVKKLIIHRTLGRVLRGGEKLTLD